MNNRLQMIFRWFKYRLKSTMEHDRLKQIWFIIICWISSTAAAIVVSIGNPTGVGLWSRVWDISKAVGLNSAGFAVFTIVVSIVLSLIYMPLPRLGLSSFIYVSTLVVIILIEDDTGTLFSFVAGIGYSVIAVFIGYLIIQMIRRKAVRYIVLVVLIGGIVVGGVYTLIDKNETEQVVKTLGKDMPENPSKTGPYDVNFISYGSGEDLHREAFGDEVDEVVPTIDASERVTKWPDSREEFWGFDSSNLPLNGRVWMPEGEGPFPLILMVHGNHTMEYFSTGGYDYLGKQLASRGFIFISVDEDFINYSNVSGAPNDNYELRAWMLLQHLLQLKDLNKTEDSLFAGKIDFNHVGLAGHSRGGQAAPMAADYERFFNDEEIIEGMRDIQVQGVVSVAPTDKRIDGDKPELYNTSYLLLQGAQDADISDFRGERQYYRTNFGPYSDYFKASLFIANANHVHFNSDWGSRDLSLPRGIFLDKSSLIDVSDQQEIAKVYFTAFFERVFNNDKSFDDLFKNHQYGSDWLPDTAMVSRYEDAKYKTVRAFNDGDEVVDHLKGFSDTDIITPKNREGGTHFVDALRLKWEDEAVYEVVLNKEDWKNKMAMNANNLHLTLANIDEKQIPDIDIEITSSTGIQKKQPLDELGSLTEVIKTDYTLFGLMDNIFREGKYETAWAPTFQTIEIPLESFGVSNEVLMDSDYITLNIYFNNKQGEILLEEIGVS